MKPLTLDALREILPDVAEVRPLFELVIATSRPATDDRWASSAVLGTTGSRHAELERALRGFREVSKREVAHLTTLHATLERAVEALAEQDVAKAAATLLSAAELEEERNRPDHARAFARGAHAALASEPMSPLKARTLRRAARAARALGDLDLAFADYVAAAQAAETLGDVQALAEAAIGAGNVLEDQGQWDQARAWYRRALDFMDGDAYEGVERWHALLNLSVASRWQGHVDLAESALSEAERVAERLGDSAALPFLENARGQLLMAAGDFEGAVDHLVLALAAAGQSRARVVIGVNLSEALLASGRTLEAAEEARRAEGEAIASQRVAELPEVYRVLGRLAAHDGESDAFVLFERALALIDQHETPKIERAHTLSMYADAEARLGRIDNANDLENEAIRLYRELGVPPRARWADTPAEPSTRQDHDK